MRIASFFSETFPSPPSCPFLDTDVAYEAPGSLKYEGTKEIGDLAYRAAYRYEVPDDCLTE